MSTAIIPGAVIDIAPLIRGNVLALAPELFGVEWGVLAGHRDVGRHGFGVSAVGTLSQCQHFGEAQHPARAVIVNLVCSLAIGATPGCIRYPGGSVNVYSLGGKGANRLFGEVLREIHR